MITELNNQEMRDINGGFPPALVLLGKGIMWGLTVAGAIDFAMEVAHGYSDEMERP